MASIIIKDECWIGASSIITAEVQIGKHSIIAGGSVSIPPYAVVGGNPAYSNNMILTNKNG